MALPDELSLLGKVCWQTQLMAGRIAEHSQPGRISPSPIDGSAVETKRCLPHLIILTTNVENRSGSRPSEND